MNPPIDGLRKLPLRLANVELYQYICDKFTEVGLRSFDFAASVVMLEDSNAWQLELCFGERMEGCDSLPVQKNACHRDNPVVSSFVDRLCTQAKQTVIKEYKEDMMNRKFV